MRKLTLPKIILACSGLALAAVLLYWYPPVNRRLSWRLDAALTSLRAEIQPAGAMPTVLPKPQVYTTRFPTPTPFVTRAVTETPGPTSTPVPSPTPLPKAIALPAPRWEKQDWNNCGPTTLAMYLRFYGWKGDQFEISSELKPLREDRNVNVEEIAYYVRTKVGWLRVEYRVAGDIALLKQLLATGMPVMIEESDRLDTAYWNNDDRWAAHYFLVNAYDDATRSFTGQDSYFGANRQVSYSDLDQHWQAFNRVYILVYPPEQEETIKTILGQDWDADANRQRALEVSQAETRTQADNPFTWFNLGSNLVYFERYIEATDAYAVARKLGLPQRMFRYQFGPFIADFHSGQIDDLLAMTGYALRITPTSEEALLWRGWAYYRKGRTIDALADFRQALNQNPNYQDAQYALDFVNANP